MKYQFTVVIEGEGKNLVRAYQDMRQKLLPLKGWADTDVVISVADDGKYTYLAEPAVQAARKAFPYSVDGKRRCNGGPDCVHDVVVGGIPACMMSPKEIAKMVKRGKEMQKMGEELNKAKGGDPSDR